METRCMSAFVLLLEKRAMQGQLCIAIDLMCSFRKEKKSLEISLAFFPMTLKCQNILGS